MLNSILPHIGAGFHFAIFFNNSRRIAKQNKWHKHDYYCLSIQQQLLDEQEGDAIFTVLFYNK